MGRNDGGKENQQLLLEMGVIQKAKGFRPSLMFSTGLF